MKPFDEQDRPVWWPRAANEFFFQWELIHKENLSNKENEKKFYGTEPATEKDVKHFFLLDENCHMTNSSRLLTDVCQRSGKPTFFVDFFLSTILILIFNFFARIYFRVPSDCA